jgi:hypothetical protein
VGAKKVKDIAVKTGEYQKDGQTKGRYENVGSIFKTDDGGTFILLKRTFNPAGVPNPDDRDTVLISVFDLRDADAPAPQRQAPPPPVTDIDDSGIPF